MTMTTKQTITITIAGVTVAITVEAGAVTIDSADAAAPTEKPTCKHCTSTYLLKGRNVCPACYARGVANYERSLLQNDAPATYKHMMVSSSFIAAVGYNVIHRTLEIEFRSGEAYEYSQVPSYVYDELIGASSAGQYFSRYIRDKYAMRKLPR
jgi:hypothetical protein